MNDWIKANGIEDDLATIVNTSKYPDERKKIVGFISSYGPNEATKQLRALWKPNGKEDSAKKKVIEDYVSKNIKSKPDLATFLYSKDYTDQRNDAIKQPDLKP